MFFILQEGASIVDPVYTRLFHDLGPLVTGACGGSYPDPDPATWTGDSNKSPPCQKAGLVNMRFPIDLQMHDTGA